jgi:hypothetical protein
MDEKCTCGREANPETGFCDTCEAVHGIEPAYVLSEESRRYMIAQALKDLDRR